MRTAITNEQQRGNGVSTRGNRGVAATDRRNRSRRRLRRVNVLYVVGGVAQW